MTTNDLSASELAMQMAAMRNYEPKSERKALIKYSLTPERAAEYTQRIREWDRAYSALRRAWRIAHSNHESSDSHKGGMT